MWQDLAVQITNRSQRNLRYGNPDVIGTYEVAAKWPPSGLQVAFTCIFWRVLYVFTRLKALKDRSLTALVTGRTKSNVARVSTSDNSSF